VTRARANGIELEYEVIGDDADEPMLLVMGFSVQMIQWPDGFLARLRGHGFRLIRFDNRDVGLSSKVAQPYALDDMADDTAGLLDALGIRAAHVVGASMGGFISQLLTIRHPDRVLSLASIMSSTGARDVGQPHPAIIPMLMTPPPAERGPYIETRLATARRLTGSTLRSDEARVRASISREYDRCFYPQGAVRQFQAIIAAPDRTAALGAVRARTVVIHGTDDELIDPSGGVATAKAIPGAHLLSIPGMGHDLPEGAWDPIARAIAANAAGRSVTP
jgi:pimeloyl-ACP methyl ester carboxylesterase